jgi:copper chaperone
MVAATAIKEITTKTGKMKYQAQVWHKGLLYASKTFDSRPLARAFKERELTKAVQGALLPAAQRRAQREADTAVDQTMGQWATLYLAEFANRHCATRLADCSLVGRLLAQTPSDLAQHLVIVEPTEAEVQDLSDAITEAGYTPVPVQAATVAPKPAKVGGRCG